MEDKTPKIIPIIVISVIVVALFFYFGYILGLSTDSTSQAVISDDYAKGYDRGYIAGQEAAKEKFGQAPVFTPPTSPPPGK